MPFKEIDIKELKENFIKSVSDEWMLISAGNSEKFNMMTASWGGFGEMWGDDVAAVVIRPQRYTKEFVDNNKFFSLTFFGDDKSIHGVCGKQSGREVNKAEKTGLKPVFDEDTVYFEQARLVVICEKIYCQKVEPECFVNEEYIEKFYPQKDFHYTYVGKIKKVLIKE